MRLIRPGWLVSGLLLLSLTAGCGAARRPEQQNRPAPPPVSEGATIQVEPTERGTVRYPSPRAGSAYDDPSQGVSTVASAVPGAGSVDAVILGNVALVGLPSGDRTVHHKVADQIQASFPHIVEVRVSTDPAVIHRLRAVRHQIINQRSIAPFLPELVNLSAGMQPVP
ncbi:MAG: YhcN/YlaJ family sporulation lipoprotein [Bacillota bacterium]